MKAALAALAVLVAGPAFAQSGDCRAQAYTIERELSLNPRLSPSERYMAERELSYAQGLCASDPNRGAWQLERLRRENLLAEQPRLIAPSQDRWNSGGVDDLEFD
jgi:hypothetical protein